MLQHVWWYWDIVLTISSRCMKLHIIVCYAVCSILHSLMHSRKFVRIAQAFPPQCLSSIDEHQLGSAGIILEVQDS